MIATRRPGAVAGIACLFILTAVCTGPRALHPAATTPAASDARDAGAPSTTAPSMLLASGGSAVVAATSAGRTRVVAARPQPTAQPARTMPTLAGTNLITAVASGYVQVRMPQDTTIGGIQNRMQVSGNGRFAGAILRPSDAGPDDGRAIVEGSVNHCWSAGCVPDDPDPQFFVLGDFAAADSGQTSVVPAGLYDLYVITDGSPVAITMTFNTLGGSESISPTAAISPHFEQPAPSGHIGTGGGAVWAGSANPVGDPGFVLLASSADGRDPLVADMVGLCLYNGGPPAGNVYQPDCPGSDTGANIIGTPQADSRSLREAPTGMFVVRGGDWNLGGYFDGVAATVNAFHFISVGLDLNHGLVAAP